jgi:ADP-ribose pyrophosphatase YjhB (NUDIX family)
VPAERFRIAAAVYGILRERGRILLMRRAGTGYRDDQFSLPAGHLDGGEDVITGLIRELREELGIEADPRHCRFALLMHTAPEDADDHEYFHVFFSVDRWSGEPHIAEPAKCTELRWVEGSALPSELVDYVGAALEAIARGDLLTVRGW